MARSQLDPPLEPLEDMLAKANAAALAEEKKPATPPPALTDAQLEALTDDDIRRLSRKRLLQIIATSGDDRLVLSVIREMLDRIDGKPAQTIQQTTTLKLCKLTPEDEAMARRQLIRMARLYLAEDQQPAALIEGNA